MKIRIRSFRAVDEEQSCLNFIEGHKNILEIYGVTKITSNYNTWMYNPENIVVMVESEDGKILGGARIEVANGRDKLPIEKAIGHHDPKIYEMVQKGSSEICGLWNSKEVAGLGIGSVYLGRVTAALIGLMRVDHTYMLCAPATVRMCKKVGCIMEKSLGNNGIFYYPKEDLVTTAMIIPDPITLTNAEDFERKYMFSLRENLRQTKHEIGIKGQNLEIEFSLSLPHLEVLCLV